MEKRALIAFVLSMAVFFIWSQLMAPTKKEPVKTNTTTEKKEEVKTTVETKTATEETEKSSEKAKTNTGEKKVEQVDINKGKEITVKTDLYTAVFSESGGRLKSFKLVKYRKNAEENEPKQEVVSVPGIGDSPLGISLLGEGLPELKNAVFKADKEEIDLRGGGDGTLKMTFGEPGSLMVVRKYEFKNDTYMISSEIALRNLSENQYEGKMVLELTSGTISKKDRYAGFTALIDKKLIEQVKPDKIQEKLEEINENESYGLKWASYGDQYFLAAVIPEDNEKVRIDGTKLGKNSVKIGLKQPTIIMEPNTEKKYKFSFYYGPRDFKILKALGNGLEKSIHFGWFDILAKPLLIFMTWLHKFVPNYGIVIIIVTILIKAIFWPLTAKSYKSMKGMQRLQPKIMGLREKYKDDREAMNREMMQLYKTYKINPLGGCLPMVIQIPVFIALYRLLDYSLELRHAPFWLWIQDLSAPDRLFHFGVKIPLMQEPSGIPILTLLMGATMLLQQKMTPTPGDPTQAKIMMLMPIFFTFIFINFPAGLVLYWLTNNILSIGQQTLINKRTT